MKSFRNVWKALKEDESGQDLIEYALIAGVVSLAAVTTLPSIASSIKTLFGNIQTALTNATTPAT
jgi:pilus assembly protein Flp/PilA